MESPKGWNLLTSSLAVSDRDHLVAAWPFLAVQGLVRDGEEERRKFGRIVEDVQAEGEITGPSQEFRVAQGIVSHGINTPLASQPDPWGEIAQSRRDVILSWLGEQKEDS